MQDSSGAFCWKEMVDVSVGSCKHVDVVPNSKRYSSLFALRQLLLKFFG